LNFITEFQLDDMKVNDVMTALTYFAFTTLSTVGLGDYHPKSDQERLICALIMLFGVTMTTFLMDNLMSMINKIRTLNNNYEESQMLALFFGTLKRFNGNSPLPKEIQQRIEEFFLYRWQCDPNLAVCTEGDQFLLE